jgi:hypothetical protein
MPNERILEESARKHEDYPALVLIIEPKRHENEVPKQYVC